MKKSRRWALIILFPILLGLLITGIFLLETSHKALGHKFIGSAITGSFFFWMPLFIYHRWKDRNLKDYMLTEENIKKMRAYTKEKDL